MFNIAPDTTLALACGELDRRRVSALIVCDGAEVVGVIPERDVFKAIAADGTAGLERPVSHYDDEGRDLRRAR